MNKLKKLNMVLAYIFTALVIIILLYVMALAAKNGNYYLFYEDMVKETINEMGAQCKPKVIIKRECWKYTMPHLSNVLHPMQRCPKPPTNF